MRLDKIQRKALKTALQNLEADDKAFYLVRVRMRFWRVIHKY